jgi:hypothetical protein
MSSGATFAATACSTSGASASVKRPESPASNLPEVPAPLGGLGISVSKDEHWLLYTRSAQWQGDIIMISGF